MLLKFDDALSKAAPPKPVKHPEGWQPGMTWTPGEGGELVTAVTDQADSDPAFWQMVIADWGLDPTLTEIVPDSVQIRAWDMNLGGGEVKRARYYKARIRPRRAAMTVEDELELVKIVMRKRTKVTPKTTTGIPVGYVLNLSDFQIGKGEGGGTLATVERITAALHQSAARVKELHKAHNVASVWLVGMGDLAEQCFGHYPSQQFTVDRTRREQLQIVRELITLAVDVHADLAPSLNLGAVPGNHGENRKDGKSVTTVADNDDLAVFDQVAEKLRTNPRYDHVRYHIADELVLVRDVEGVPVAWTHMHQGSGSGEAKITAWWKGQVMGNRPVAQAQILNTAHYHHFLCSEATGRTLLQMPAMDGGSGWWTDKTGQNSPPGMVSYLAGVGCGARGWSDLAILGG